MSLKERTLGALASLGFSPQEIAREFIEAFDHEGEFSQLKKV